MVRPPGFRAETLSAARYRCWPVRREKTVPAPEGFHLHGAGQCSRARDIGVAATLLACLVAPGSPARADEGATLETRDGIRGREVPEVEINGEITLWGNVESPRPTGAIDVRWRVRVGPGENGIELPTCAGRGVVTVDGVARSQPDAGPAVIRLSEGEHVVSVRVTVSGYEKRLACGTPARVGRVETVHSGLLRLGFGSPHAAAGGGHAVVFLPEGHDVSRPGPMLVMPHPWNGSVWTYAAQAELLDEAAKRDVVLLMPSGLGNSLYTAPAEDEVMRAVAALESVVAVDPARVSIAGASMGGAGATTIGFHRPDRFASITSFFGDSRYDLATYVRAILRDDAGAHAVNAFDIADNARNVPVWLVHGEDDRVSPIAQSELLANALAGRGITVRFERVPGFGHAGALFARFARELVEWASEARAVSHPSRVTLRTVRPTDHCAYGVCLERVHAGDAFVDVQRSSDGVVKVGHAENLRAIVLAPGALGDPGGIEITLRPPSWTAAGPPSR